MSPAWRPLAAFAALAQPRAELWRTALGLVLTVALYWGAVFGTLTLIGHQLAPMRFARLMAEISRAGTPAGLAMLLATFVPMALAVLAVTRALHRRGLHSLLGPGAGRDALRAGVPLFGLALALFPLAFLDPNVGRSVPPATVLRWLPVMLPLLLVQIAAEELIFRGYLLQQLAARSRSPWVWMVAPSALFGALHYSPAEFGPMALWPALWAMGFGCLAADLTARTGNLGAALALHFTNNLSSMILVGLYGQLDGLALYTIVINPRDAAAFGPYLAADVATMLVAWLAARLALRV